MALDWLTPSHFVILGFLVCFAIVHSGLAALRSIGEAKIGARAYRIVFALASLGLAVPMVIYFFNHRYDGAQLWNLQGVPGIQTTVWILSAISFLFLYPATFNLLEVAALKKPQVHLYETGIIRISRHPQMVGQVIWCFAHLLWLGTSFMVVTCAGLVAHHLFAVWHGDRRLAQRYGEAFNQVKDRTSVIPFLAILQGHQSLKWQEFLRPAYVGVGGFVLLFWWLHPLLIQGTSRLYW
ncbi:NnrU family protein [Alkalinema pantanalense CENA528]|uniref:NnrU family protein n=1 Tax=Alkalinema pantanalense TaxID=1620705 RepID=UPI003D6F0EE7